MKELYIEDLASHGGPESCVGCPRGRRRSVDRGRAGGAIEPRNSLSSGCRRVPKHRKATSLAAISLVAGGPCAVRDPRHVRQAPCARTGRSRGCPAGGGDAPSWMVRGVANQRLAGREGNAEAVI